MAASQDAEEYATFVRLSTAANKYGKIWFTDVVTQRETKQNQVMWMMVWNAIKAQWEVSNFLTPAGALEITKRMRQPVIEQTDEVIEINIDDLVED